jgi:DNA polymerase III epsilon subunit-like protein
MLHRLLIASVLALAALTAPAMAQAQEPLPSDQPERFGLALIDVETTGLNPQFHEIIDFGAIYIDLEGRELGRLYVRIMPDHPERIDAVAKSINGFDVDYWRANGAVSEVEALRQIEEFHRKTAGARSMIFTAYNVQFDVGFTDAFFAKRGRSWRELWAWNALDLPSMAWGMGLRQTRNTPLALELGVEPETTNPLEHIGMSGAIYNLELYRAILARQAKLRAAAGQP